MFLNLRRFRQVGALRLESVLVGDVSDGVNLAILGVNVAVEADVVRWRLLHQDDVSWVSSSRELLIKFSWQSCRQTNKQRKLLSAIALAN
jgi:hypothetical protein